MALLAAGIALWLPACAAPPPREHPHAGLTRLWREYSALPEQRALAIAGELRRDRWVAGAAGGQASGDEAEAKALAECQRRRAERRFQDPCLLYAVGDEIVWPGP